ncbi:MAG: sulfotransferase domain-containing protein, partial [Verrucomicrobia bacterium]
MAIEITSRSLTGPQSEETTVYKESRRIPVPATDKSASRSRLWRPAPRWTRRNFSSRASELSGGEAIILSVPKSGRTWLRAFLCVYFCKRFGLEFTLRPERYRDSRVPRLIFSHDLFEHRTKGELRRAKIILLVRDPRDCFVSLYLQLTRRDPNAAAEFKQKTVSDVLRDRRFGVRAIIMTMNDWLNEFSGRDNFTLTRYESLRASPAEHFRDLLALLGESAPEMPIFHEALDFSRFENMQK